jgi:hypothetical protein
MKTALLCSIVFCAIVLPALGELTPQNLNEIRFIVKDEINREVASSERQMKAYISQQLKTVNFTIAKTDKRFNQIFWGIISLIILTGFAVGFLYAVIALRSRSNQELNRKIEELISEIESLKQQIVNS